MTLIHSHYLINLCQLGHHAEPGLCGGFCFVNNAMLASLYALKKLKKVAVLDFDIHHGNVNIH